MPSRSRPVMLAPVTFEDHDLERALEVTRQAAEADLNALPEVDTVFFMTALEYGYLSSSLVKEIARFGGDVSAMVPAGVAAHLRASAEENPRL